jgi:hypothetical protein
LDGADLKSITEETTFYQPGDVAGECRVATDTTSATLPGSDNPQKAFNYFTGKGLQPLHAAAIVGNLIQESGVNPKSNQAGSGIGKGIAQWSDPGRWRNPKDKTDQNTLVGFAGERDIYDLGTQLDFMWHELQTNKTYRAALSKTQEKETIEDATAFFMGTAEAGKHAGNVVDSVTQSYIDKYGRQVGYENPGSPALDKRIENAKAVLSKYGNVSGSDSSCGSSGAVNCNPDATIDSTLSPLRQKVVCLAKAELALWQSGKMKPGTDFYKYTNNGGKDEQWCGDFISWLYNEAGYPVKDVGDKWERVAFGFQTDTNTLKKFEFHPVGAGYVPQPGDVAVHSYSHVNLVVSVNTSGKKPTVTVIGGNQGGDVTGTGTDSSVKEQTYTEFGGDSTIGYASPRSEE